MSREETLETIVDAIASTRPVRPGKVFLSHARSVAAMFDVELDDAAWAAALIELHRARRITLARCDLVEAFDRSDVRDSEIAHVNAAFHFALVA